MTTPRVSTVLISGVGQLGSRHLQGLARCRLPLGIYVQDVSTDSLELAERRWNEVHGRETPHQLTFETSLEALPREIDVAIVATTAAVRPQVVRSVTSRSAVRFWVLEKVLAQSESGLDQLLSDIRDGSGAWVNTPRRMMHWHRQIKSQLGLRSPLTLRLRGGAWGLACNAIHLLDLVAWWTGETLQDVRTDRLNSSWFESKRPGFWEVLGTLEARFSGGSLANLCAAEDGAPMTMEVTNGRQSWLIDETGGVARRGDGIEIAGRTTFQSEMSGTLVESILVTGRCELPRLDDSAALHRVFLQRMQEHWRRAGHPAATFVPIT